MTTMVTYLKDNKIVNDYMFQEHLKKVEFADLYNKCSSTVCKNTIKNTMEGLRAQKPTQTFQMCMERIEVIESHELDIGFKYFVVWLNSIARENGLTTQIMVKLIFDVLALAKKRMDR